MASPLSSFGKAPIWQIAIAGVLSAGLVSAAWYFLYYEEAAQNLENAKVQLDAANAEKARMEKELENYEQRRMKIAEQEAEMAELIRSIPSTEATVDHLMKPFQRQARLVGFEIDSWAPGAEQRFDYYAKTPVEIHASGTWHEAAEFFRKVSEMEQVVNIEEVRMNVDNSARGEGETAVHLRIDFSAASFRFLPQATAVAAPATRRQAGDAAGGAAPAGAAPAQPAPETKEG